MFVCDLFLLLQGFARLTYGDFVDDPSAARFEGDAQKWANTPAKDTVNDREAEKAFASLSKVSFESKCAASDTLSRQVRHTVESNDGISEIWIFA